MTENPLISVIIPVYNVEEYLRQCLDSIINQTLNNIEIICINDGSPDNCLQILREYERKDKRIVVIDQENTGVGKARNNGLKLATGEFVAFMDPDDYYPDDKILETMYGSAKEHDVNICGGSFSEDHYGTIVTNFRKEHEEYKFAADEIINYRDYQFDYGYMRFIYNLKMLRNNNISFPAYIRYQDPPFFVKAMICAEKFYALKMVTYCYRWGHQNINWNKRRVIDLLKGITDNLEISGEFSLSKLHYRTVKRLNDNYTDRIIKNINKSDMELLRLLIKANNAIDISLLKQENPEIPDDFILEPLRRLIIAGTEFYKSNSILKRIIRVLTFFPRLSAKFFRSWRKNGLKHTMRVGMRKIGKKLRGKAK